MRLLAVACACLVPAARRAGCAACRTTCRPPPVALERSRWTSLSAPPGHRRAGRGLGRRDDGARGCRSAAVVHRRDRLPQHVVLGLRAGGRRAARHGRLDRHGALPAGRDASSTPNHDEVACGLAATGKPGARPTRRRTSRRRSPDGAAGRPTSCASPQVINNSPSRGLPTLTVRFAGRDVTAAPHPRGTSRERRAAEARGRLQRRATPTDMASRVDPGTAHWEFHDKSQRARLSSSARRACASSTRGGRRARTLVVFRVKDFAGNESMYRFTTARAGHRCRPDVSLLRATARSPARAGCASSSRPPSRCAYACWSRRSGAREPLLQKTVKFWGDAQAHALDPACGAASAAASWSSAGVARDLAGNATALPLCIVDPVSGQGSCGRRDAFGTFRHGLVTEAAPSLRAWRRSAGRRG